MVHFLEQLRAYISCFQFRAPHALVVTVIPLFIIRCRKVGDASLGFQCRLSFRHSQFELYRGNYQQKSALPIGRREQQPSVRGILTGNWVTSCGSPRYRTNCKHCLLTWASGEMLHVPVLLCGHTKKTVEIMTTLYGSLFNDIQEVLSLCLLQLMVHRFNMLYCSKKFQFQAYFFPSIVLVLIVIAGLKLIILDLSCVRIRQMWSPEEAIKKFNIREPRFNPFKNHAKSPCWRC
eukprot:Awhi_evm1s2597